MLLGRRNTCSAKVGPTSGGEGSQRFVYNNVQTSNPMACSCNIVFDFNIGAVTSMDIFESHRLACNGVVNKNSD